MSVNLDFTDVKDGFEVVPAGKYPAKVVGCEKKRNKADTGDNLNFTYEICDGGEYDGSRVFDTCALSKNALWRLKAVLKALGFDVSGAIDFEPADVIGLECSIEVITEVYEGKDKNRIKTVEAI